MIHQNGLFSIEEINLIKQTQLFSSLDENTFHQMLQSLKRIHYPRETLIFSEGEKATSLYIIVEGSVRVFSINAESNKIPLARLNKGDYFGEQAFLGQATKTRNANIEAISEVTLIEVGEEFICHLLNVDIQLKSHLKETGFKQALQLLSLSTGFYKDMSTLINHIENPEIKEFQPDQVIFNEGDKPDNVYIVLQGNVKLLIPDRTLKKYHSVLLHKGHLFGELAVLKNTQRAATAISQGFTKLLATSGENFKKIIQKSPQLKQMLSRLQQMYQMPMVGIVEQYVGNVQGIGEAITNVYKMEDGRSIIGSSFLNQDLFVMSTVNVLAEKHYHYEKGSSYIAIEVTNGYLTKIKTSPMGNDLLPPLCQLLLDHIKIEEGAFVEFRKTGEIKRPLTASSAAKEEIICDCMLLTRAHLQQFIDQGYRDFESLSKKSGACSGCGGCKYKVLEMLGKNLWTSALMTKEVANHPLIHHYYIKPNKTEFKPYLPGQHLIIQAKIQENWIERPYTISGMDPVKGLRITIQKEANGYFTKWLFNQNAPSLSVNVSQPHGEFLLDLNKKNRIVCFAGGIGITPFTTFAKALMQHPTSKEMHLIYSARNPEDFVLKDELEEIAKHSPSFKVTYRTTSTQGKLTEEEIIKEMKGKEDADVYICGSTDFTKAIQTILNKISHHSNKIHIEQFVHAG